ncbi:hypothetical protein RCL1_004060 [Eukaryota sp. TZLM3-RCL]
MSFASLLKGALDTVPEVPASDAQTLPITKVLDEEIREQKVQRKMTELRRDLREKAHAEVSSETMSYERSLLKVATKGAVTILNTILEHQKKQAFESIPKASKSFAELIDSKAPPIKKINTNSDDILDDI